MRQTTCSFAGRRKSATWRHWTEIWAIIWAAWSHVPRRWGLWTCAHLAEGKTRAQTKLLDDYEKRHNLVALSSEGEAESVASRLLDQSKNRKRKRSTWTPRPISITWNSHWYDEEISLKPFGARFTWTSLRNYLFQDVTLWGQRS